MTDFVNVRARLLTGAALAGAFFLAASAAHAQRPGTSKTTPAANNSPAEILRLINQERAKARLKPLRLNSQVSAASRRLANNMARQNRFVWTVGGKNSAQLLRDAGYTPALYKDFGWDGGTAKDMVSYLTRKQAALVRSPRFTDLGVAVARSAKGVPWFCLVFASPSKPLPPPSSAPPKTPPPPPGGNTPPANTDLNAQVLAFARAQLGTMKQIGDGQCTALVIAALQTAGAKTTYDYGVSGLDADYRWGDLVLTARPGISVASYAQVKPGDALQYRHVGYTNNPFITEHHSALVSANLGGGRFRIIEQNYNNHHYAEEHEIDLSTLTQGTVWIYRPVKK